MNQKILKLKLYYDSATGDFFRRFGGCGKIPWTKVGSMHKHGYVQIGLNKKFYLAHRLAWLYVYGEWPNKEVDHINGKPSDNRICNLRLANRSENIQNQRVAHKDSKSGYLGVIYLGKNNTWRAQIGINNKIKNLGYYKTPQEAHQAYLNAKRELHQYCTI
jgi:hypothetical protein